MVMMFKIFINSLNIKNNKPFALICKTTKGYPIKYMMNVPIWHYRSPNKKEYVDALKNLYKHYKNEK